MSAGFTNRWDKSEDTSFVGSVTSYLPLVVDNQPLTLNLTPVMASQLVQMFGPSGTGLRSYTMLSQKILGSFLL